MKSKKNLAIQAVALVSASYAHAEYHNDFSNYAEGKQEEASLRQSENSFLPSIEQIENLSREEKIDLINYLLESDVQLLRMVPHERFMTHEYRQQLGNFSFSM